jgi:CCR4-NOT transcription complex subunit 6
VIPTKVLEYGFLTGLYLSHNHLRVIPAGIGRLRGLQLLDVSSNHIRVVPPEIGLLLSLKELNLSNNEIDNLPLAFGKLFCLQVIRTFGGADPTLDINTSLSTCVSAGS